MNSWRVQTLKHKALHPKPACSRSLGSTCKSIHSLRGAEDKAGQAELQKQLPEHLSWAAPSTHRHGTEKPESSRQTAPTFSGRVLSPGGRCTPQSPWRGAGEELQPSSAHSSPSPTLSKAGALPLGCLIWLPLQKAQKETGNSLGDFREKLLLSLPAVKTRNHKQQLNFPPSLFLICRHFIVMW